MLVFGIVLCVHLVLQFLAWAAAPGNAVPSALPSIFDRWWPFLSFPVFWVFPKSWSDTWFWSTFVLNSLVWAIAMVGAITLLKHGLWKWR